MCKNSGESVNLIRFIHINFTLDENKILNIVVNWYFVQNFLVVFKIVIHNVFSFYKSVNYIYTAFPHKLLLLLLSIKLNIINKNLRNGVMHESCN